MPIFQRSLLLRSKLIHDELTQSRRHNHFITSHFNIVVPQHRLPVIYRHVLHSVCEATLIDKDLMRRNNRHFH